jgi:hypothetical protein
MANGFYGRKFPDFCTASHPVRSAIAGTFCFATERNPTFLHGSIEISAANTKLKYWSPKNLRTARTKPPGAKPLGARDLEGFAQTTSKSPRKTLPHRALPLGRSRLTLRKA